jgi:hypothetical protein
LSKDKESKDGSSRPENVSRRDFFTKGAAAGVTAAAFGAATVATAAENTDEVTWDYTADVVVLGGGATGLAAAVRARDLGASVILLEQNYDLGGKMAHSSGWITLGGGDAIQERDRLGLDPDNLGLTAPIVPPEALEDSADLLFEDTTDWSVVNAAGIPEYRFNDPDVQRAWAENAAAVRQFFIDNYVRFSRITGNNYGGGVSRARGPWAIMKLADKTDIEAGTVSLQDAGSIAEERSSPFNPQSLGPAPSAAGFGAPGWVWGGFVAARSLEYSGRKKGVQFMVNRHLDELIRDGAGSGRVIGVRASYTPRFNPETGERLEAFWSKGSIDDKKDSITVRARKGVIIGTGGWWGNVNFRTMFNPRYSEPSIQFGHSWLGPRHQDASGIMAGMKVGANLGGMLQSYGHGLATPQGVRQCRHGRCLGRRLSGPPHVPVREGRRRLNRFDRLGLRHCGQPSRQTLLQRGLDRQGRRQLCCLAAGPVGHQYPVCPRGLAKLERRAHKGCLQRRQLWRRCARHERGVGRSRIQFGSDLGDLRSDRH